MVAVDVQDSLAEHLDEAAVGVPREALVTANGCEAEDRLIVEADVQDGFHHAGHGEDRTGTDREQQGIILVPKRLPASSSMAFRFRVTSSTSPSGNFLPLL